MCSELTGHRLTVPAVSVSRRFDSGAICHSPLSRSFVYAVCAYVGVLESSRERQPSS